MGKSVVITGVGFLNDWGAGNSNLSHYLSEATPKTPIEKVNFDSYIDTSLVRRADYISICALVAAKLALGDAGLPVQYRENDTKVGVILGTVHGPMRYTLDYHSSLVLGDPKLSSPILFSDSVPNASVSHISAALGIRGYATTISGYCSVAQALQLGSELIEEGTIDVCLIGGADVNHDFLAKAYRTCLNNSKQISKSFGGSGFIVIESLKHAVQRKAKVYASLDGVTTVTASYPTAKLFNISPLHELFIQMNNEIHECDCLLSSSYDEEDSRERMSMYLCAFKHSRRIAIDCSNSFGCGFSATEVFNLILGIIGVYNSDNLHSFKEISNFKKNINRLIVMMTAPAGANSCALFSSYSECKQ